MKSYPHIDGPSKAPQKPCYGFVKYDGSNLRTEWSKKRGFYKWGTRKMMVDESEPVFGPAIPLFLNTIADGLEQVFKKSKLFIGVQSVVVFFEYFGSKSFGGMHFPDEDQTWMTVPFDINPHKKGFLGPKEFLDEFGHLKVAEHIWTGNFGEELVQDVRKETFSLESQYDTRTPVPEGIICKGGKGHDFWMRKVKTERYKAELKERYRDDWISRWE